MREAETKHNPAVCTLPPPRCSPFLRLPPNAERRKVDAGGSCQSLTGEVSEHCLALGYSQTAMSVICGGEYADDDHCGTFLELHMGYENSYAGTEDVLSETRLLTANVTVSW